MRTRQADRLGPGELEVAGGARSEPAGERILLAQDLQFGQRFLERQNAVVRNASVGNVQLPQAGHSSEVREPGITDLGCSEIQLAKVTQTLDFASPASVTAVP